MPDAASAGLSSHRLIRCLLRLEAEIGLDRRDYVIFGSAPLLAHGLVDDVTDLDIVARRETWERAAGLGVPALGRYNGAPTAEFCDGRIQFSAGWISKGWDADTLIDSAEIIDGLPFARLSDVLRYKEELDRPKDRPHIAAIRARQ